MFVTALGLCSMELFKLERESQTIYRKPQGNVTKLKSEFSHILG